MPLSFEELPTDHLERRTTRAHVAVLAAITLVAGGLRFAALDLQSFSSDEAVTALLVRMDLGRMLETVPDTESTPPFYYIAAWAWSKLFGNGEIGLRSLSALVGTATVPIVYAAAAQLVSRAVGVASAAVIAVSPPLLQFSQEARSYAVLIALTALSLMLFARAQSGSGAAVVGWAIASALALATHYFAVFAIVPQAILLARRSRTRRVALAVAVPAVVGLSLVPLALAQRANGFGAYLTAADPLATRVVIAAKQLLVGEDSPVDKLGAAAVAVVLVASLALVAARARGRVRSGATIAAVIAACITVAPVGLALVGLDYIVPRNLLPAVAPLAIAACTGLAVTSHRYRGWLVVAGVCVLLAGVHLSALRDSAYRNDDWRGLAREVAHARESRLLVVAPNLDGWTARPPLRVYLPAAYAVDGSLARTAPAFIPVLGEPADRPPTTSGAVREIVVAAVRTTLPLSAADVPAGFDLVEMGRKGDHEVALYRRQRPVHVDPASLVPKARSAVVLMQPAAFPQAS